MYILKIKWRQRIIHIAYHQLNQQLFIRRKESIHNLKLISQMLYRLISQILHRSSKHTGNQGRNAIHRSRQYPMVALASLVIAMDLWIHSAGGILQVKSRTLTRSKSNRKNWNRPLRTAWWQILQLQAWTDSMSQMWTDMNINTL